METTLHILVVDDHKDIRDLLAKFLVKHGMRVTTAADATEARRHLKGGLFDLIVLDIMMPGEDGLSLCRSLARRRVLPNHFSYGGCGGHGSHHRPRVGRRRLCHEAVQPEGTSGPHPRRHTPRAKHTPKPRRPSGRKAEIRAVHFRCGSPRAGRRSGRGDPSFLWRISSPLGVPSSPQYRADP